MSDADSGGSAPMPPSVPGSRAAAPSVEGEWRSSTPFARLAEPVRADALRAYGMYGWARENRVGSDAYGMRDDVTVSDACETAAQLLRALIASLEAAGMSLGSSPLHRDVLMGCVFMARQAAGALAVVGVGAFPRDAAVEVASGYGGQDES